MRIVVAALAACTISSAAPAWAQAVERAPTPDWVAPLPTGSATAVPDDAPVRLLAIDDQIRFDADGVHSYYGRRSKVQTQQGLGYLSTVSVIWDPTQETVQVHKVRIVRGDQVIDVLDGQSFEILRRESNLESSMLDGQLTATLQPRDLRVGDVLEIAFTIHHAGGVLAPHREQIVSLGNLSVDHYRLRASWPAAQTLRVAATEPWIAAQPRRVGADWVYEINAPDLKAVVMPNDVPSRFLRIRTTQFTDFADWSAASTLMWPLYERASTLEPDSPLKAEIERIRAAEATPAGQAAAALRLVQDEVRYLALSMGEGGYVPASADEVWRARYGDCKGKTVLLLALLHGLGIEAEAAMVSTENGDGLPERLPAVGWFDHVLVRAVVDGQTYWMDGASAGDRSLQDLKPPPYRWALPIRPQDAAFTPIVQPPLASPTYEMAMTLDASAGLDVEAGFVMDTVYYGAAALQMRRQMSAVTREQLQTVVAASAEKDETMKIESVDTRYDDAANAFHLVLSGKTRMTWINGVGGGRVMALPEASVSIPNQEERTGLYAAYNDLPYTLAHPFVNRMSLRITLPNGGEGFRFEGGDQTVEAGGYRIERRAAIKDGVADVSLTTTSLASEISAEDMAQARTRAKALPDNVLSLRAPANYQATAAERERVDPGSDDVARLIERADRLAQIHDLDGALALLDAALAAEPENAEVLRKRGAVRMTARDYAGARADYDRAVDLDPADAEAAVGQGDVASTEGRYADAVVSYSVALRLDPSQSTALSGRAYAYYQIGRFDRSLSDFRALKSADETNEIGLWGELRALRRLNRSDEARTLIAAKLEKTPDNYAALQQLLVLGKADGRLDEVLRALDAALAEAPDQVYLLTLRGEARAAAGDAAGARADFETLRGLAQGDPTQMNNLCWSQAISGFDLDQALADCDVAAETGEAANVDSRAMALLQLGRYEEAKAAYDQALTAAPNLAASLYGRGRARLALGDAGGQEDLDRARVLDVDVGEDFAVFDARHPSR